MKKSSEPSNRIISMGTWFTLRAPRAVFLHQRMGAVAMSANLATAGPQAWYKDATYDKSKEVMRDASRDAAHDIQGRSE